ncbi:hypothetical protein SKAU_G00428480 [Synaphobranchus kaupii]|uniref:AIG1-type G domain-containing protein n=1 Tax=Synaphobranchus kaupii TaxID=118154 RepID=A0A9Q1E4L8_SYNKA|nr:hypothetical protein SKAU_G00428480 [Synaphobranchus kaupii]
MAWMSSPPIQKAGRPLTSGKQGEVCGAGKADLRLVLLGGRNSGKSSAGNAILRRNAFAIGKANCKCTTKQAKVAGMKVTVVDTPGWNYATTPILQEIKREMERSVSLCSPGPHAFLLAIPVDSDIIQTRLHEHMRLIGEMVWRYTLVLFTCGDRLADSTIEQYIVSKSRALQRLLGKCENRYHVLNNLNMRDENQVTELLKKVESMRLNNIGCYRLNRPSGDLKETSQMLSAALEEGHIFGPTLEEEGHIFGPTLEEEGHIFGPTLEEEGHISGPTLEEEGHISGPTLEEEGHISGPALEEEGHIFGPTLEEEGHIFGPTLEEEGHISGPALEEEGHISGPTLEEEGHISGPTLEEEGHISGPALEEEGHISGPALEEEGHVCGPTLEEEEGHISGPTLEEEGHISGPALEEEGHISGPALEEEGHVCGPTLEEEGHVCGPTLEEEGHISGPALEVGAQQGVWNVEQARSSEERQGERNAGMREAQAEREEPIVPMERAERMERGAGEKEAHLIPPSPPNTRTPSGPASHRQALQQLGETVAQLSEVADTLRQTYEDQAREEAERHGDATRQLTALRAESAAAASEYSAAVTQRDEERDTLQAESDRLRENYGEEVIRRYEETAREVEQNRVVLQQFRALVPLLNTLAEGK